MSELFSFSHANNQNRANDKHENVRYYLVG